MVMKVIPATVVYIELKLGFVFQASKNSNNLIASSSIRRISRKSDKNSFFYGWAFINLHSCNLIYGMDSMVFFFGITVVFLLVRSNEYIGLGCQHSTVDKAAEPETWKA